MTNDLHQLIIADQLQVEKRLAVRLEAGMKAWMQCLIGQKEDTKEDSMDTEEPKQQAHKLGGEPIIKVYMQHSSFLYSNLV